MMPFRITEQSKAFLDWLFMLIKEHVLCIFDLRVAESYGRMKASHSAPRFPSAASALMMVCAAHSKGTKVGTWPAPCGCRASWPLSSPRTTRHAPH